MDILPLHPHTHIHTHHLIPYTKIISKWNKDQTVRAKIRKLLGINFMTLDLLIILFFFLDLVITL